VDDDHPGDEGDGQEPRPPRRRRADGEEEQGNGRAERRAGRVTEAVERRARCGRQDEDRKRRPAPGDERQAGERGQHDPERVETARACSLMAATDEERERGGEHGHGDPDVERELGTRTFRGLDRDEALDATRNRP
jgi:hypothetical protein